MKQKPDEMLDQWVRQVLHQLPDAPPPGSTFDAERVWTQLRPELQATTTRRKIGLWWVAAACLTGLTLGWFWLIPLAATRTDAVVHISSKPKIHTSPFVHPEPIPAPEPEGSILVSANKSRLESGLAKRTLPKRIPKQEPGVPPVSPIKTVSQELEVSIVAVGLPVVRNEPTVSGPVVVGNVPKRRFKVVHENELRAEEAAKPQLYRTESFVRLGTGRRTESMQDDDYVTPVLSITNKTNQ